MGRRVRVGSVEEFPEGKVRVFDLGEERVAVANVEGAFYAFEDRCSHDDAPLGAGHLEGCQVICPRHGARFDVRTGAATRMPAVAPLGTWPVHVGEGGVEIEFED